jgi:lycopene cyclase domain-containing protein
MTLYGYLLLLSIAIPLTLSFDKKVRFFSQWPYLFPAILLSATLFIAADIALTTNGIWGFNSKYHSSLTLAHLPIEEWLFFIVIPYASIFLHECIVKYFPNIKLSAKTTRWTTLLIAAGLVVVVAFNTNKTYTAYIGTKTLLVLLWTLIFNINILRTYLLTFLVILLPFILVNAILTGSFIDEPVVWYNNSHNLGIRFLTIPIEDFAYAFSVILLPLFIRNQIKLLKKTANSN